MEMKKSKKTNNKSFSKRIIANMLIIALTVASVPTLDIDLSLAKADDTSDFIANSINVSELWDSERESYHLDLNDKPTADFWADTSGISSYTVDEDSLVVEQETYVSGNKEYNIYGKRIIGVKGNMDISPASLDDEDDETYDDIINSEITLENQTETDSETEMETVTESISEIIDDTENDEDLQEIENEETAAYNEEIILNAAVEITDTDIFESDENIENTENTENTEFSETIEDETETETEAFEISSEEIIESEQIVTETYNFSDRTELIANSEDETDVFYGEDDKNIIDNFDIDYYTTQSGTVAENSYNLTSNPKDSDAEGLYYTLKYDSLYGYYKEYYVSSANQLSCLLYKYSTLSPIYNNSVAIKNNSSPFSKSIGIYYDTDLNTENSEILGEKGNSNYFVPDRFKLSVVLISDIDLGGQNNYNWKAYSNTSYCLEINGNGHKIYNGYYLANNSGFIGKTGSGTDFDGDNFFAIENVTFSNQYIGRAYGIFGRNVRYAYFNNVNFEKCVSAGIRTSVSSQQDERISIVLGTNYAYCYFKDCVISESAVRGSDFSRGHSAMFASFNGYLVDREIRTVQETNGKASYSYQKYTARKNLGTYIGDSDATDAEKNNGYYYTEVPSLSETERAWFGMDSEDYGVKLNVVYPSIYQSCAVNGGKVYEVTSNGQHSGIFVSCVTGQVIFKNCFANGDIYGFKELGGFTGGCLGREIGFNYSVNNEKTQTNTIFENCYTTGTAEGARKIGGFVGMVFNDKAATQDSYFEAMQDGANNTADNAAARRGIVVFKNCYTTTSVGMQYSAQYLGGFVGIIRGNIQGTDKKHKFINCYAAGEVGSILINNTTDDDNYLTIGGFAATLRLADYGNSIDDLDGIFQNCYYDKQTTGMRERDIGYLEVDNMNISGGKVSGLTGVYTKVSEQDNVKGLASFKSNFSNTNELLNSCFVKTSDVTYEDEDLYNQGQWSYKNTDYYPQLNSMRYLNVYSKPEDGANDLIIDMYSKRYDVFKANSMASTATVFLDHYEQLFTVDGIYKSDTSVVNYNESLDGDVRTQSEFVYDTIRDITSKFQFTTIEGTDGTIKWEVDKARNKQSGFFSTIAFSQTYDVTDRNGKAVTTTFNPSVIEIVQNPKAEIENEWQCNSFAPGKSWVKVSYDCNGSSASRSFRLLPTAYLNAGSPMTISVNQEEDGSYTNLVTYNNQKFTQFNQSLGVIFAITDKWRVINRYGASSGSNKKDQIFTNYHDAVGGEVTSDSTIEDHISFAVYGTYGFGKGNVNDLYYCFDSADYIQKSSSDTSAMVDQFFNVTNNVASKSKNNYAKTAYVNSSSHGYVMAKVYPAKSEDLRLSSEEVDPDGTTLKMYLTPDREKEITDKNLLKKWAGIEPFETSDMENENGNCYYYIEYTWRLNDGRAITDLKLVKMAELTRRIDVLTGVSDDTDPTLEQDGYSNNIGHKMNGYTVEEGTTEAFVEGEINAPIDQYISDEIVNKPVTKTVTNDKGEEETVYETNEDGSIKYEETWDRNYPSKNSEVLDEIRTQDSTQYYKDNLYTRYNLSSADDEQYAYSSDTFYYKAIEMKTDSGETVVGWHKDSKYRLVALSIEVFDVDGYNSAVAEAKANGKDANSVRENDYYSIIARSDPAVTKLEMIDSLESSEYTHFFTSTVAIKDDATNYYTIWERNHTAEIFKVESEINTDATESYIKFNIKIDSENADNTMTYSFTDRIRVIALFRPTEAVVSVEKNVIFNPDDIDFIDKTNDSKAEITPTDSSYERGNKKSFDSIISDYKVDNADISDTKKRKAVLSGDKLTYIFKVDNIGYYDSGNVDIYDKVPENVTLVENSMKIFTQGTEGTSGIIYYDNVNLQASFDSGGNLVLASKNSGYKIEIIKSGDDTYIHYSISSADLFNDYYLSYEVVVNQLSADILSTEIDNTAEYSYITVGGNIKSDAEGENKTYSEYIENSIFDMTMQDEIDIEYSKTSPTERKHNYTITFTKKDTAEYKNYRFQNAFPDGFTVDKSSVEFYIQGSDTLIENAVVFNTENDDTADIMIKSNSKFKFNPQNNETYVLKYSGIIKAPDSDKTLTENVAVIAYDNIDNDEVSIFSSLENRIVEKIGRTNQVETDATHLYFDIEKQIDTYDPTQTFLFKIDRYETDSAGNDILKETFYETLRCTDEIETGGYKGIKRIETDKRGKYVVTEITSWSDTDYDFNSSSYKDIKTDGYSSDAVKNSDMTAKGESVTFNLPRIWYKSTDFPTYIGLMEDGTVPKAVFKDNDSEYAFKTSQAYAENKISD
jgi:uncharacterized repeat protein (TIGR01451 family)